jgi:hypothetical protein
VIVELDSLEQTVSMYSVDRLTPVTETRAWSFLILLQLASAMKDSPD